MERIQWLSILISATTLFSSSSVCAGRIQFQSFSRQLLRDPEIEYPELGVELLNDIRREHRSIPLKLNHELQASAQAHANYLLNVTGAGVYGYERAEALEAENISETIHFTSNEVAAERFTVAIFLAMVHWYDEESRYDYNHPKDSNFTRMIWKSSTDLGVGVASNGINKTVIVARFWPGPPLLMDMDSTEGIQLYKLNVLLPMDDGKNVKLRSESN